MKEDPFFSLAPRMPPDENVDHPSLSRHALRITLESQLPSYFLRPGEIFCSATPHVVTTVLGSCVSVCLFDSQTGIGGMNHVVLPFAEPNAEPSTRHGEWATDDLIQRLVALGSQPKTLRAKVFGGGEVFGQVDHGSSGRLDIGRHNVAVCRDVLKRHRIPVISERVHDTTGLTIKMVTSTGDVWVRRAGWHNKGNQTPPQDPQGPSNAA